MLSNSITFIINKRQLCSFNRCLCLSISFSPPPISVSLSLPPSLPPPLSLSLPISLSLSVYLLRSIFQVRFSSQGTYFIIDTWLATSRKTKNNENQTVDNTFYTTYSQSQLNSQKPKNQISRFNYSEEIGRLSSPSLILVKTVPRAIQKEWITIKKREMKMRDS